LVVVEHVDSCFEADGILSKIGRGILWTPFEVDGHTSVYPWRGRYVQTGFFGIDRTLLTKWWGIIPRLRGERAVRERASQSAARSWKTTMTQEQKKVIRAKIGLLELPSSSAA
jgi:hypothetical protein